MEYTLQRIKNYRDEKNGEYLYSQCSQQLNNPAEGSIEITTPRKYKRKNRLGRRLETAIKEFYSKQGFHLKETSKNNGIKGLHFEREINFLEKYLISIERQGIFFYIHISHN